MDDRSQKTLLLVDGSSYLYRAYHALPDLRNRKGEPSGAIYGVLNMLRKLLRDYKPDYAACVFDAKGPTFRHEQYPDYKGHRSPMPPDLASQVEPLQTAVQTLGWPLFRVPGVEADDVIGTLTRQAVTKGLNVLISSGDKDMVQLLSPSVKLMDTLKNETLDMEAATRKYGLPPERFVDYLTLIGDTADNVPGVTKVGPKTALKWVLEFGGLEQILARADEVPGIPGKHLRETLDWLPKARDLLTIRQDVPLTCQVEDLRIVPADPVAFGALVEHYDLKSWQAEVPVPPGPSSSHIAPLPPVSHDYETILTEERLTFWLDQLQDATLVALDTETTSLHPLNARLVGLSFCMHSNQAAYLPLAHQGPDSETQIPFDKALNRIKPWLEDEKRLKVGQHMKFDQHVFANHGIALRGIAHDTMLESYVLEAHQPHNLENLARRHLNRDTLSYEAVTGKGVHAISFAQVALSRATEYAAEDADMTWQVHQLLYPQLEKEPALRSIYADLELPLHQVLWLMERNGVLLDRNALEKQSHLLGQQLLDIEARAHLAAGHPFNLNSPKQIQTLLFEEQGLPVRKKTPGGVPSTDEEVLQDLALDYPLPKLILEYRGLAKLKSTYTDALPRCIHPSTGRVHTHYAQSVAVTGRLASSDPNLQNIPVRTVEGRRIRAAFLAPPGKLLVSANYSQIELRIMAHLSQDPGLLNAFANNEDVHCATAAEIFGIRPQLVTPEQRRTAKAINFGLIYGMSAFGLARQLGLERSAAQTYMQRYFDRYPGVARYMESTRERARQQGYVETLFGRRLWLPELRHGAPARRQGAERAAINAPLQGSAADLIKRAMISVQNWLDAEAPDTLLILQVHDELVLEVPDQARDQVLHALPGLMEGVASLSVPLKVDIGYGPHWDAAH